MNKLKQMFKGGDDKAETSHSSGSAAQQPMGSSSTGAGAGAGASAGGASGQIPEGVILHTTLGDITIALYKDQTPRVSHTLHIYTYHLWTVTAR